MTDEELDKLYKQAACEHHAAALRTIFERGMAYARSLLDEEEDAAPPPAPPAPVAPAAPPPSTTTASTKV